MQYICAIIKDEHDYIREWAEHHRALGFDKIVLYDNNSSRSYEEELGGMLREGYIEMRRWPSEQWSRQLRAYNDFLRSGEWGEDDWCAFIDADEFIYLDEEKSIKAFVEKYRGCAGVGFSWKTYNANGRIRTPKGMPLKEAYSREFEYWEPRIKPYVRLKAIECIPSPHYVIPKEGLFVTPGGELIWDQSPQYKDYRGGHIKHYITKSWEDWVKRLKRGNITRGLRKVETFFEFNPDLLDRYEELTKDLNYEEFPTIGKETRLWDGDV